MANDAEVRKCDECGGNCEFHDSNVCIECAAKALGDTEAFG